MSEKDIESIIAWLKKIDTKIDDIQKDIADIKKDNAAIDKRTTANEGDLKECAQLIAKLNVKLLACQEKEKTNNKQIADDIRIIKGEVRPVREATTAVLWLRKHWIVSLVICAVIITSIMGFASILHRWPIGKNISNMTVGDIWNIVSNFKK